MNTFNTLSSPNTNTLVPNVITYTVRNAADISDLVAGTTKLSIARTDGKKGKSGLCIVVNEVSDSVINLVFNSEHGKQWIAGHIDSVRSGIASGINKAGGLITSDRIGIDAICKAITAEVQSTRFSKESIVVWFDSDLMPLLQDAIRSKLVGISTDKLAHLVNGYRNDLQLLAARDVMISADMKMKLEKALGLLADDYLHPVAERLAEKLQAAGNAVVEDVL